MSMFYGGQLQAMLPKLHSKNFEGMELIRPMYCIHEDAILDWKRYNNLQFIQCACRFTENCAICDNGGGGSKRQEIKTLIRRLKRDNPNIEKSIFNSIHNVNIDTMPGYKTDGDYHTFLENLTPAWTESPRSKRIAWTAPGQLRQKNIGKTGLCFFPESAIVNTVFNSTNRERKSRAC